MLTKTQIFDTVETLPENVYLDELIDKLLFIEKVNIGLKQSEKGMVSSEEEVCKKLSKWLG
jgi:predicted transcriptional regulator